MKVSHWHVVYKRVHGEVTRSDEMIIAIAMVGNRVSLGVSLQMSWLLIVVRMLINKCLTLETG